jgi:hypothetical protein
MTALDWAQTWGEVVNKTTAARMLGCSRTQIHRMIDRGDLQTSADGRVLVREAFDFMHGKKPEPKRAIKFVK